jgi:lysozyme
MGFLMADALDPQYLDAIKGFEGYSAQPQWDYKQSSSGYGTKAQPGDENIPPDQLKAVHEQRFQDEVGKAASAVDSVNPNLPPAARAALTSFTYNTGPGWTQSGLGDLVRNGDLSGIAAKMQEYNKAGGQVNPGLVSRRAQEASWITGTPPTPSSGRTSSAPPAAPLPQQQQPIFAAAAPAPVAVPALPTAQPPSLIFARQQAPNLSGLKAALAARPIFAQG